MNNSKKNILILSPFFYPEPISTGKFNTDFAKALKNKGHKVTVLCYHPFYPNWTLKKSNDYIQGINIIRGGSNLLFTTKTIFRRLILEISFTFFVIRNLNNVNKDNDIIIPVFPPSLAFSFLLFFLKKEIRKIGMVHDLQEIYSKEKRGFINKIVSYLINKIENNCYRNCDKIIFLSSEMKDFAKKLYSLDESKLEVKYPFITLTDSISSKLNTILNKNTINIVYSGALGEKQNPYKLIEFFQKASKEISNSEYHLFSQGAIFDKLKNENKNKNVKFHDLVKKELLEELYFKSSVQIVPQKENTSKGSLPSKLPNLLASKCKVFVITDPGSEIEKIFNNNNLDLVVNSWDNETLIDSLKKLLEKKINFDHQNNTAKKLFTLDSMITEVLS